MARPKRQRTEVTASIELPPTTRRRRSSHVEPLPPVGVGGKADTVKKSSTKSNENKTSRNTTTTNSNDTMKNPDDDSKHIPNSKKNATMTDAVVDGAPIQKTTRSQPSISSSTAAKNENTTTHNNANHRIISNDIGNDHADDDDNDVKAKTSQVDVNAHIEISSSDITSTDPTVVTTTKGKNNTPSTSSTSKAVYATTNTTNTTAITTTKTLATTTSGTSSIPKSAATTTTTTATRRSSHLQLNHVNNTVTTSSKPIETSTTSTTTILPEVSDAFIKVQEKVVTNENPIEVASSLTLNEPMVVTSTERTTTEPKRINLQKEDIMVVLQHRKMLLQRIRQCRTVTEQRLHTATVRCIDEETETAIFNDTMKQVLSLARKQARLEQQRDGNNNNNKNTGNGTNNNQNTNSTGTTTVSLRRGNSVGKRMNAAISTLTGSSGNSNIQQQQQQQQNESSGVVPLKLATVMNTTNDVALNSMPVVGTNEMNATMMPLTKNNQHKNSPFTNVGDNLQPVKSVNKRSDSSMSRTMPKKSQNVRMNNDNVSAHHQQQRNRINTTLDANTLNHTNHIPHSYSSSNSMKGGTQYHNQQHHNRVVCPETTALRNRRDEIRNKLSVLLKSRQHVKYDKVISLSERRNSLASHVSSSSLSPRSTVLSSKPITTASLHRTSRHGNNDKNQHKMPSTSSMPIWESPDGPPSRPPRRKTHWDTVLEEMRWMATDFIEEQKWKYAVSRVLSVQASTFVSSSKKQDQTTNPPAKQLITNVVEKTSTSDSRKADEHKLDINHKDSRTVGKFTSSVVLSNFQAMTINDAVSAKNIARQLSDKITDMVNLNNVSCGLNFSNLPTTQSVAQATIVLDELDRTDAKLDFSKEKAEFILRASTHVDHVLKTTAEKLSIISESDDTRGENCNMSTMQPTTEQLKTLQMIEDRWQRNGVGSVIHGPRSSGKTIVACSLLHRNRSHGPQILICPSASVIRWIHELSNFEGLNIVRWDDSDAYALSMRNLCTNDILLCQRSSMLNFPLKELSKFSTMILDCRYAKQSHQQRLNGSRTEQSICAPTDLSSQIWWKRIIDIVCTCDISRRLLVDSFESDNTVSYFRGLMSKVYLAVTALRTSFLVGPKCFVTPIYPFEKAILAWARQRTKEQTAMGSKFSQVNTLLNNICASCHCSTSTNLDIDNCVGKFITWDVRYCTMTQTQRFAYDRACQQSRLILSKELDSQNEKVMEDVVASLLLLRRHCIHSNIDAILHFATSSSVAASHKYRKQQICGRNAAQPDAEFAYRILSGSCKLRNLVSILRESSGYKLFGHLTSTDIGLKKNSDKCASKTTGQRKKIVIIAGLPEIQLLVSCLLRSLGIDHEILLTHSSTRSTLNRGYSQDSVSWSTGQTMLSKFNGQGNSNTHIVISSLAAVEGDHVGLGIESADSILLLDEDWSGQEERLLHSVISRCFQKRVCVGKSSLHVVRILSAGTCEETFLRDSGGVLDHADALGSWLKLHDTTGFSNSSELKANGQHESCFLMYCFPGQTITRHCNKPLDDVLRPKRSLSLLNSFDSHYRFLPISHGEKSGHIETMITSCLLRSEISLRGCNDQVEVLPPKALDEIHPWQEENDSLPPLPLRDFVRQQNEAMTLQESGSIFPLANVTLATKGVTRSLEVSDHIERESRPILAKSPSDAAIAFLLYSRDSSGAAGNAPHRGNRYALSFSTLSGAALRHDGNQGVEALVYFPPVFPKLRECVDTAISDMGLKLQHQAAQDELVGTNSNPLSVLEGDHIVSESTDLDTDFGLAGIGILPSFQDSVSASAGTVAQSGTSHIESIDSFNGWYSSISPINAEEYQTILQHRNSEKTMKTVILMVSRKRLRGQSNTSFQARYGAGVWNGISSSISELSLSVDVNGVNKKGKKAVSAFNRLPLADTPQHSRPIAFTFQRKDDYRHRLLSTLRQSSTGSGSTIFEAPIFRVAAVRIRDKISERLQNQNWITSSARVNDKSFSGLPLASRPFHENDSNKWTNVIGRTHKSATNLDVQIIEMANQQTISFKKSHFEPRRVDFGPFQLGFVSSMSGMTSIAYPRPRIGVTLPMGVKISIVSKEQTATQWSKDMDRILLYTIDRFGTNWILASQILRSFYGMSISHKESNFYSIPCAPRSCRDRWRSLSRHEEAPKRYNAILSTQDLQVGGDAGRRVHVASSSQNELESKKGIIDIELLVPSSIDHVVPGKSVEKTISQSDSSSSKPKSSRRTFKAFQLGLAKQQNMPVPIAGVTSVITPCHPSHEVTVQMSTMAANGRTDMWPLQILDGAERLRTAAATSSVAIESAAANAQSVPSRRPVSMPTRPHNSSSNARSGVPSNHRGPVTNPSQIPVQRATTSSGTSGAQRPTSQRAYTTNHMTASKQPFVPPMPSTTKVPSTPKVQAPTTNPMQPPQSISSQPSKVVHATATGNLASQSSAMSTNPSIATTSSGTVVPTDMSKQSNGTTSADKVEPSKAVSVPQGSQNLETKKTLTVPVSTEQAHPTKQTETVAVTTPTGSTTIAAAKVTTVDVTNTSVSTKAPEKVATDTVVTETIPQKVVEPSVDTTTTVVVVATVADVANTTTSEDSKPVDRTTSVPDTILPTLPVILPESTTSTTTK